MAVTRWDPFRDLVALQERMNRLFDESLRTRSGEEEISTGAWMPPVDIYETDSDLVLKVEVPEIDRKDIEIKLENGILNLRGQRKLQKEIKEDQYHRIERAYGVFSRSFTLPSAVDPEKVNASYKDGVLTIRIGKREETKPRTIEIK